MSTTWAQERSYIGAKKCGKACHFKQHKSWKTTKMATAYDNLKPGVRAEAKTKAGLDPNKDYTTDPECLSCHTTGYGKPGGFVDIETTPQLAGITCEACHGPGSDLIKKMTLKYKDHPVEEMRGLGLIYPPKEDSCTSQCHNDKSPFKPSVDSKYEFKFDERVKNLDEMHKHFKLKYKHPDIGPTLFQESQ